MTIDLASRLTRVRTRLRWKAKQAAATPGSTFYGDGGTIHSTGHLDVEVHDGKVVAVWFRCQTLAFEQHEVDAARATHMAGDHPRLTGVEIAL